MEWEQALISKVIETGELKTCIRMGVRSDDFADVEYRSMFDHLVIHYQDPNRGGVPSLKYIVDRFPEFEFTKTKDKMGTVIERVREARLYRDLRDAVEKAQKAAKEDSFEALQKLQADVISMVGRSQPEPTVDITKESKDIESAYARAKKLKGLTGLEYPWEQLTLDSGGANPGDLIVIAGRPGTMKTNFSLKIATHWHSELGKRVLVLTKEMMPEVLRRRAFAQFAQLPYMQFSRGKLPPELEKRMKQDLKDWSDLHPFMVRYVKGTGMSAMLEIKAIVEEVEPEAIVVDGFYFVGERDYKITGQCTSFMNDCLKFSWKIPGVINTQLNQEAGKDKGTFLSVDGGAYGDSYAQDADLMCKIKLGPEEREMREAIHYWPKMREGTSKPYAVHARPFTNMEQKRVLHEGYEWMDEDDEKGDTKDQLAQELEDAMVS